MTKEIRELKKRYNGSLAKFEVKEKPKESVHTICNSVKMPKGVSFKKLIVNP